MIFNYKDIVKTDEDKKEEIEEMEVEDNENENEDEEIENSFSIFEKSFELPIRIKIEDDNFKKGLDTYNYNML